MWVMTAEKEKEQGKSTVNEQVVVLQPAGKEGASNVRVERVM